LGQLLRLEVEYSFDNVTESICVEPLCGRIFGFMNSYGKHIKSHFNIFINTNVAEHNVNTSPEMNECNNVLLNNSSENDLGPESYENVLDEFKKKSIF